MKLRQLEHIIKDSLLIPVIRYLPLNAVATLMRIIALPGLFSAYFLRLKRMHLIESALPGLMAMGYIRTVAHCERLLWRAKFREAGKYMNRIAVEGAVHFSDARAMQRGLILVTTHSFYFRLLQYWLNQPGQELRPYLLKHFPSALKASVERHGEQSLVFDGRLLDARAPLGKPVNLLKGGNALLMAQDIAMPNAQPVRFLDRMVNNPFGAAKMAEMTDSVILPVLVYPTFGRYKWTIRFWPPILPGEGSTKELLRASVERMILEHPEVWQGWRGLLDCRQES